MIKNKSNKAFFTTELLLWNRLVNKREMPWKNEKDPYKIWISEIILQQTRVQQGTSYYNRFISRFPSVKDLANAEESEVFKLWEGLGYYSRCKNIIASAKYIAHELDGKFPKTFEHILQLKGVGNYTASAIASFAYNHAHAVLDGNVYRVLSRFFGIIIPIDGKDKSIFATLSHELLDHKNPGKYNQAIMDFGATICKPKQPECEVCPLQKKCYAFANDLVNSLPVKEKTITKKTRWMYYLLIEYNKKWYVRKRTGKDIWQNLHEFVLIESTKQLSTKALMATPSFKQILAPGSFIHVSVSEIYTQLLTHQTITGMFIRLQSKHRLNLPGYSLLSKKQLDLLAFPKFITAYLKD